MSYQELAIKIANYEVEIKRQRKKLVSIEVNTPFRFAEIQKQSAKLRLLKALRQEAVEKYKLMQTKIDFDEL